MVAVELALLEQAALSVVILAAVLAATAGQVIILAAAGLGVTVEMVVPELMLATQVQAVVAVVAAVPVVLALPLLAGVVLACWVLVPTERQAVVVVAAVRMGKQIHLVRLAKLLVGPMAAAAAEQVLAETLQPVVLRLAASSGVRAVLTRARARPMLVARPAHWMASQFWIPLRQLSTAHKPTATVPASARAELVTMVCWAAVRLTLMAPVPRLFAVAD